MIGRTQRGATPGTATAFGTPAYRGYVLNFLLLIYILNFIDRNLLSVVAPELKPELRISDTAFGLLTGFGFALLYTVVGIPLAQLAERVNRVKLMAACIALWSVMTALCGLSAKVMIGGAAIGGFWILLACRVGVGIGESGCTPPANSLIADYFPPHRRAAAVGYYAMGVTLGTVMANLIGGPVTDMFGWRWAFFVVGLPGIVIALVFVVTVREPPRGHCDPPELCSDHSPTFGQGLRELAGKTSFWWMTAGCTIASFCGYGIVSFQSLFINRTFGLSTGEASIFVNVPVQTSCALGTLMTGWLAGKLLSCYPNAVSWIPAWGMILSVPVYIVGFSTGTLWLCVAALCFGGFIKYGYLVTQYTVAQGVVSPRFRAVSTAIMLFVINLLGYGLGPLFIGAVSDMLFKWQVQGLGAAELTRQMCEGKAADLADAFVGVCNAAHPESLQDALLIMSVFYALAGMCLLFCCRTLQRDLVVK